MAGQARCKKHPAVPAGWTCNWCHAPLCPDCVALEFAGGGSPVEQCCLCGGQASRILRKRTELSYLQRLPGALVFPFSKSGLLTILAAGLFVYVLRLGGSRGGMIAQALLWTYVFGIIRAAARGKTEIEPPDITSLWDLVGPALHGGLATLIVWVPAVIYIFWGRPAVWPEPTMEYEISDVRAGAHPGLAGMPGMAAPGMPVVEPAGGPIDDLGDLEEPGEAGEGLDAPPPGEPLGDEAAAEVAKPSHGDDQGEDRQRLGGAAKPRGGPPPLYADPLLWLILILGVLYAPMALTIAAAGGSWLDMLSPFRVLMAIKRIPGDYLVLVFAAGCLATMVIIASVVGTLIDRIPIPFIPGWIAGMLSTYPALVTGQAFGLLLYVRGADIGYLPAQDAYESTGDTVTPRGTAPSKASAAQPAAGAGAPLAEGVVVSPPTAARFAAMGVGAALPGAGDAGATAEAPAQPHQRYAPISLDGLPAVQPAQPVAAVPLAQALRQALAAKDLAGVAELYGSAKEALPAALHFDVGRAAGGAGNNPLALQALKAVVQVAPRDPLAPKALVLAARVYGERMGDAPTAARIWAHLVAKYPGTEAAAFAQQRLAAAVK